MDKLEILQRSFGDAKLETPEFYKQLMLEQGFKNVQLINISKEVIRTVTKWKENALEHKENILKLVDDNAYNDFLRSYDIIHNFFINDVLGYCLIKGDK
jgi:cyclopropane fatty-acyl-phospholipid synthase-like methyltransferase